MVFVEDNDAILKVILKGRCPTLKQISRTHKINLDWLFERIREDPSAFGRYIHTKLQLADMLTKGNFTTEQWHFLCSMVRLGPPPTMKPIASPRSK